MAVTIESQIKMLEEIVAEEEELLRCGEGAADAEALATAREALWLARWDAGLL